MDIYHIEARYKDLIVLPEEFIKKLPKELVLFTTVQFLNSKDSITKQLNDAGIKTFFVKPRHTKYEGQILGCSTNKFDSKTKNYLYVGDGLFHPKALILRNDVKVYTFDPKTGEDGWLDKSSIETIKKKVKTNFLRFLTATNVGVLITLKPGQNKEYMTKKLEEQYPDKNFYYLVDHTINFQSLVDFPFIDMFLNTMCERIGSDDMDVQGINILNLEDMWDMRDGFWD
jgi:diphthamide biosynthesis enzyme Dph1/Dph2-like protein